MERTEFTFPLAPVTTGRVLRLRRLLRELGLIGDPATPAAEAPKPGTPRRLSDVPTVDAEAEARADVVDVEALDRALWDEERVLELVPILFDVADDDVDNVPVEEVGLALVPFALASDGVTRTLAASGRSLG